MRVIAYNCPECGELLQSDSTQSDFEHSCFVKKHGAEEMARRKEKARENMARFVGNVAP